MVATAVAATLSITVAIPAQLQWFLHVLTGGRWVLPEALVAVAATLLIEGLCWLGAFLYAESVAQTPVRLYRATTFLFASVAAAINYAHGSSTDWKVGVVYALASLMGVGAWELYMHRTRHVATGMDVAEIRLWALRWRKHPQVMRELGRIRATHGLAVSKETAWRMAYLRKIGNPTVPVAVTAPLIERIVGTRVPPTTELDAELAAEAEPASTTPGVVGVEVLELPAGWDAMMSADQVVDAYWPELRDTQKTPDSSAGGTHPTTPASSGPVPQKRGVTSAVPQRKRNQFLAKTGTGRVQFPPTKAELNGPGDAKERIHRYLTRAELKGNSVAELDRNYIAAQFRVTARYVRNTITLYSEGNGKP